MGNPSGFVYTRDDHQDLVPGTHCFYWLEDISLSGATTLHGPVSVAFVGPTAVTLGEMAATPTGGGPLPLAGTLLALLFALAWVLAGRRRDATGSAWFHEPRGKEPRIRRKRRFFRSARSS